MQHYRDEDLHIELENPGVPFEVIDKWCQESLGVFATQGNRTFRTYYFKNPKDVLLFRLKWL